MKNMPAWHRKIFSKAGVSAKVDLRLGKALELLPQMIAGQGRPVRYDLY
jgi:hypothetical protein